MKNNPDFDFYFINMKLGGEEQGGSMASIAIVDLKDPSKNVRKDETFVASVAIKPFIWVLWTGTVVFVLGFFVSVYRRRKELFLKAKK
jgi:cytochrome c biogenesis factor